MCRVYKKTKCLRAFDRRPPPSREIHQVSMDDANNHGGSLSSSTVQQQQVVQQNMEALGSSSRGAIGTTIGSSPESSSSGGDNNNDGDGGQGSHVTGEAGQMDLDDEALLDWEQIDWFLAKHDFTNE